MLDHLPPRRDPRILVLDGRRGHVQHVAIDPWELRSLGHIEADTPRLVAHALAQLVLSVRPSHVVVANLTSIPRAVIDLLARRGVQVVRLSVARVRTLVASAPRVAELREHHVELRGLALGPLTHTVRLAVAAQLHLALPSRRYALPRQPSRATPALAPRGPRRHPPAPGASTSSGRRTRER